MCRWPRCHEQLLCTFATWSLVSGRLPRLPKNLGPERGDLREIQFNFRLLFFSVDAQPLIRGTFLGCLNMFMNPNSIDAKSGWSRLLLHSSYFGTQSVGCGYCAAAAFFWISSLRKTAMAVSLAWWHLG